MVIKIKGRVTRAKVLKAFTQIAKQSSGKSLKRHFGKLKRGMDGLEYQKRVRDEWTLS